MKDTHSFVLNFLRDVVETLADVDYQKRVWVKGEGPECDSFDETINDFFYYYESIVKRKEIREIKENEIQLIKKLKNEIDTFDTDIPWDGTDEGVLSNPGWPRVVNAAEELSKQLRRFKKFPK